MFVAQGLGGMVSIFYLALWPLEWLRQRHIRSAGVLPRVLPELASETQAVQSIAPKKWWNKRLLLLLICLCVFSGLIVVGWGILSFWFPVFARILDAFIWLVLAVSFVLQLVVIKR